MKRIGNREWQRREAGSAGALRCPDIIYHVSWVPHPFPHHHFPSRPRKPDTNGQVCGRRTTSPAPIPALRRSITPLSLLPSFIAFRRLFSK
jgi:hypothetical protein